MTPIPKTFLITGLGRSGTAFLAEALGHAPDYRVVHEWKIPRTPFRDGRLTRFPLWRFRMMRQPFGAWRPGYGEVNSHLRRTLDPTIAGKEALVERRGVILRDPRDVIASSMNRGGRTDADFEFLCEAIVRDFSRLLGLLAHPTLTYERFEFRRFTSDPDEIQRIAQWAGLGELPLPTDTVERKVNTNRTDAFPRWPQWNAAQRACFQTVAERFAVVEAVESLAGPSR